MRSIRSKAHKLTDFDFGHWFRHYDGWTFEDFRADDEFYHKWLGFTTVLYYPSNGLVYCGLERFDNDIFYSFDPQTGKFESLSFAEQSNRFDVKIHRSLAPASDGSIYGATALLHDVDKSGEAPGGKLFRFEPDSGRIEILGVPVPHAYIQSIVLDDARGLIYGFTFTPERFFVHDLNSGESRDLGLIGAGLHISQAHLPVIDDAGRVWGTWGSCYQLGGLPTEGNSVRLFWYHPDEGQVNYLQTILPRTAANVPYERVDEWINGGDGHIYIGTVSGALLRLDPETVRIDYLGKPCPEGRMSALDFYPDGRIVGAAGDKGKAHLFLYDPASGCFSVPGPIKDEELKTTPEKIHSLTVADSGVVFAGEIDNVGRTGYLWECHIKE
ncbi:hypothetical protein ACFLT7_04235 [candidate division KSB1 bacterium]